MISINIFIITGENSYSIIQKVIEPIENHTISVRRAPISVSAFLTEEMTKEILKNLSSSDIDLVLLPGFVQWNTITLEEELSIKIRKGPEFASDLPRVLKDLANIELSNTVSANKSYDTKGKVLYNKIAKEATALAEENLDSQTFYVNKKRSNLMIGQGLPPLIIAEIVNCTEKGTKGILKKVKHYIDSGADIIDIGCVANKSNPYRVREIIEIIQHEYDVLLSIDSMDYKEITFAADVGIDMILSFDMGNYKDFPNLPKDIPIVLLPTNMKDGYFPKDPETRVNNLFELTKLMREDGFKKLIADPLLETPISPGISKSLETYFLYKKKAAEEEYRNLEIPLFFGISNVVELMDVDSVGINGLLASIAVELDVSVLFTVEHSTKLMGGVSELKESVKLNYVSKYNKTPPISQGIQVFKAKGKTRQEIPKINESSALFVEDLNLNFKSDVKGYFKIYVNHYTGKIYVLFFTNDHLLANTLIGTNAEALSKKIIELSLTDDVSHMNYLGRELKKAEFCLFSGKPYIQDE